MVYIVMETYEISENVWNTTCTTDKYKFGSETKLFLNKTGKILTTGESKNI
jgi:hypothetical protein